MKYLSWMMVACVGICVFLAACSAPSAPTKTPSANAASRLPKIRIGVDARLPAFETIAPDTNEFVGLDIELMKAIAAKAGFDVQFVNVGFNQLITFIGGCQLDGGVSAIPITETFKQQVTFSEPYYTTGHALVVKKGNITITGKDKLSNMTVGVEQGSFSEIETGNIPGAGAKPYPTYHLAFQDLIGGYIDAAIADKPRALSYVKTKPNNLKIVGNEFGSVNYGIAVCRTQVDLQNKINSGLAALKANGTLNQLTQKWIGNSAQ